MNDPSGTNQADQLYFQVDGATPLPSTFEAILTFFSGVTEIGKFKAIDGTLLSNGGSWTGPAAGDLAASINGTAGHTNQMNFAKLTFAVAQGLTYSNASVLTIKIQAKKGSETSNNSGAVLIMPVRISQGTLFGNRDLDISGGVLYSSNFASENTGNQGITTIRTDNSWSANNARTQINTFGVHSRIFSDSESPTGLSVIYTKATADRLPLFRAKITSFAEGLPNYSAEENIGNTGAPDASAGPAIPCIVENFQSGGMPMILRGIAAFNRGSIAANTGTAAAPNYSLSLNLDLIAAGLKAPRYCRADSTGRIYLPSSRFAALQYRLNRLTYNGPNNDAAQFVTAGNWSNEVLGIAVLNTPALSGTGATAQFTSSGVAIDETTIVNGEPVLYMTDEANHVLFEVTRNLNNNGNESDWDFLIIAGQSGVAGNVDGIGTASTLNVPSGIVFDDGVLYVNCFGSRTMRKIDINTLTVTTFFGQVGIGSHVDQFSY